MGEPGDGGQLDVPRLGAGLGKRQKVLDCQGLEGDGCVCHPGCIAYKFTAGNDDAVSVDKSRSVEIYEK